MMTYLLRELDFIWKRIYQYRSAVSLPLMINLFSKLLSEHIVRKICLISQPQFEEEYYHGNFSCKS